MEFDFTKLISKMTEQRITQRYISKKLGISENALSNKLNGRSYFKAKEIYIICEILKIPLELIGEYFFTLCEQK